MNTIEEKQIDELAAYKGKWACWHLLEKPFKSYIGRPKFNSEAEVISAIQEDRQTAREARLRGEDLWWRALDGCEYPESSIAALIPIPVRL